VKREGSEI
jgi:hypothetical protein